MSSFFEYIVVLSKTHLNVKMEKSKGFRYHPDIKKMGSKIRKNFNIEDESEDFACYYSGSKKEKLVISIKGIYWLLSKTGQPRFLGWREIKEGKKFEQQKTTGEVPKVFTLLLMESLRADFPSWNEQSFQALENLIEEVLIVYESSQQNISLIYRNLMKPSTHLSRESQNSGRDRSSSNSNIGSSNNKNQQLEIKAAVQQIISQEILLNVKFPDGYAVSSEKIQFKNEFLVKDAIRLIQQHFNLEQDFNKEFGLYIRGENFWLENNKPLSHYKGLRFLKVIEYSEKPEELVNKEKQEALNSSNLVASPSSSSNVTTPTDSNGTSVTSTSSRKLTSKGSFVNIPNKPQKPIPLSPKERDLEQKIKALEAENKIWKDKAQEYHKLLEQTSSYISSMELTNQNYEALVMEKESLIKQLQREVDSLNKKVELLTSGKPEQEVHAEVLMQEIDDIFKT